MSLNGEIRNVKNLHNATNIVLKSPRGNVREEISKPLNLRSKGQLTRLRKTKNCIFQSKGMCK